MRNHTERDTQRTGATPSYARPSRRAVLGALGVGVTAAATARPAWASRPHRGPGSDPAPGIVRVSQDGFERHATSSLAVNPLDPRNLLAVCNVGPMEWVDTLLATYSSSDGGASWHSNGALTLPAGTSLANDCTVVLDQQGRGFVCAMATSQESRDDRGVYVWRTVDGGGSFAEPTAVVAGLFADHPSMAIEPSPATGPGALHVAWMADDHQTLSYSRSPDGDVFEPPRPLQAPDDTAIYGTVVAAGADGQVSVLFGTNATSDGSGGDQPYTLRVVSSADGGGTFAAPVTVAQEKSQVVLGDGTVISTGGPSIAAAPKSRALYVASHLHTEGSAHCGIVVTASYDGGATWTPAVEATPPDDEVGYFAPSLVVDSLGRVVLTAFALQDGLIDLVMFVSPVGSLRFGAPRRLTPTPFDPALAPDGNPKHGSGWYLGDYQGLAASPDAVHPLWCDTRTGGPELFSTTVNNGI